MICVTVYYSFLILGNKCDCFGQIDVIFCYIYTKTTKLVLHLTYSVRLDSEIRIKMRYFEIRISEKLQKLPYAGGFAFTHPPTPLPLGYVTGFGEHDSMNLSSFVSLNTLFFCHINILLDDMDTRKTSGSTTLARKYVCLKAYFR